MYLLKLLQEYLEKFNIKIVQIHTETYLEPDFGLPIESLNIDKRVINALKILGIERLYKFQETAFNLIKSRENVLIVSGTGKTEAFLIPLLDSALKGERTVVVYPTKALGKDQFNRISEIIEKIFGLSVGIFDGDTPSKERERLSKNPPNFLTTTPDMLHVGLSLSERYRKLIRDSEHFVFDELHVYDGVLGSHLKLLCNRLRDFQEDYHVISASGTIGFSEFLFKELFGVNGKIIYGTRRRKGMAIHVLLSLGSNSRWVSSAY
jgi:DEAD/DEAH box helicase domain-containing protein